MQVEDIRYHKLTGLRERKNVIYARMGLYSEVFGIVDRQLLYPTLIEQFERRYKL